jgi:predicted nucleic acid-binding protein
MRGDLEPKNDEPEAAFVLDSSVTLAGAFEDEQDAYAEAVIQAMVDGIAVVPPLWMWEVTNVMALQTGRITADEAKAYLDDLSVMTIEITPIPSYEEMKDVFDTARAHRLTAYDAQYLLLAQTMGLPIATLDTGIRNALTAAGVALFQP